MGELFRCYGGCRDGEVIALPGYKRGRPMQTIAYTGDPIPYDGEIPGGTFEIQTYQPLEFGYRIGERHWFWRVFVWTGADPRLIEDRVKAEVTLIVFLLKLALAGIRWPAAGYVLFG